MPRPDGSLFPISSVSSRNLQAIAFSTALSPRRVSRPAECVARVVRDYRRIASTAFANHASLRIDATPLPPSFSARGRPACFGGEEALVNSRRHSQLVAGFPSRPARGRGDVFFATHHFSPNTQAAIAKARMSMNFSLRSGDHLSSHIRSVK